LPDVPPGLLSPHRRAALQFCAGPSPSGGTFSIRVPVEDANGFHYMPDQANMTISILEGSPHRPQADAHFLPAVSCRAAGRNGGKRGDLSP